ncbi:hypothetical protein BDW22DRAFT_1418833 [Trametopsis cervina]|nr:hypothetical protein BDW22DRAFT_1418833 [Trametopsis cervina]
MSKVVQDAAGARPPLAQLLNTLPSPLTVALVGLAPYLLRIRRLLEIVSWKSRWEESWLALAAWWAVCLCSNAALRYGLPVLLCALVVISRRYQRHEPPALNDEDNLQQAIVALSLIQSLLPTPPPNPLSEQHLNLTVIARTIAFFYVPYLALTYLVRLRVLIALVGTILLTWRARWALLIRRAILRSAHVRWASYYAWSRITGLPLPPRIGPSEGPSSTSLTTNAAAPSAPTPVRVRFLFTIYENQRWWMGLDFTAALLPGERPSWCTNNQQPVSPPAVFSLPTPTTVYLPDPNPSKKNGRIKRMARWTWEEPEWKVVVRREGSPSSARVEKPLPSLQEEGATASATRILKAAGKMRQASASDASPERLRKEEGDGDGETRRTERAGEAVQEEPYTDADGWVYGDNKWENGSAKGGIGKYTRYRKWTRVAVLTETVDYVDAGEVGIRVDQSPASLARSLPPPPINLASPSPSDGHAPLPPAVSPISVGTLESSAEDDRSRLRQRLKAAVRGGSIG